jgi:ABC-type uncharacterized transport system involved in gliding motility auxiliary subunit
MRLPFSGWSRRALARLGIVLALLLFVAINLFAGGALNRLRLDLTEDGRFTLSPATERLAASVTEPIVLRLYVSRLLLDVNPAYASHAQRVIDMLDAFQRLSGGQIRLERYDPAPFSPEEDLAVADGVQGLGLGDQSGDLVYFGLAGRNATDDKQSIPFFALDRAPYLEYDLAQLLQTLAHPDKGKIGYLGSLSLMGDQSSNFQPQIMATLLQQVFQLTAAEVEGGVIDSSIEAVLLIQPETLPPAALYALDQFVLRGGKLMVFADPFSERQAALNQQQFLPPILADLDTVKPLFDAWGFAVPGDTLAADRLSARRVMAYSQGRQVVTDYVVWLALGRERFKADEPSLAELTVLNFNSPGLVQPLEGATTSFAALAATSPEGSQVPVQQVALQPDPIQLLASYRPLGSQTLVARVTGPARSAFPEGPPAALAESGAVDFAALQAAHLSEAAVPIDVVVVADTDFLFDQTWISAEAGGQVRPLANNGDLVLNLLDAMTGQAGLATLRGRGLVNRPFTVIEAMQREAELTYRTREQELLDRIQEAETEIGAIEESGEGGVVLTPEQEAAIEELRRELLEARRELREVQRGLRDDLETLVQRLQLANIAAVPAGVALIGLLVALLRRRRAQRGVAADHQALG